MCNDASVLNPHGDIEAAAINLQIKVNPTCETEVRSAVIVATESSTDK